MKDPAQFDVILTENLFGDILSDEASMITSSIGMIPSSSLGASSCGLYEPIHGSASDIAGQHKINPTACILSASLMLAHLGEAKAAAAIEKAVSTVISEGNVLTQDMGGNASTEEFADAVIERFQNPFIKHKLLDISLNSVSKWEARCMPSFLGYVNKFGKLPKYLTFSIAAYLFRHRIDN